MDNLSRYTAQQRTMLCPVNNKPLKSAVMIWPCGDTVNRKPAVCALGEPIYDGWKTATGRNCPVCQNLAEGFKVNKAVSSAVNQVFGLSFPGPKVVFKHVEGDFELHPRKGDQCRTMNFTSEQCIKKFELMGYANGEIKLYFDMDKADAEAFTKFAEKEGRYFNLKEIREEADKKGYITSGMSDLKSAFFFLSQYCTFPEAQAEKLKSIIAKGQVEPMKSTKTESPFQHMGFGGLSGDPFADFMSMRMPHMRAEKTQKMDLKPLPYPGKPAIFEHVEGNFEQFETPGVDLCRNMEFKTSAETADALFSKVRFAGYIQGTVRIVLNFDPSNSETIKKYFESIGKPLRFTPAEMLQGYYKTFNEEELQNVYKVLVENNTIPDVYLNILNPIIKAGKIPRTDGKTDQDRFETPECATQ
jgi:hypothetical protein